MKISNPISTHGQLGSVGVDDHHDEAHALTAAAHTGAISDAQHGTRTGATPHAHGVLSGVSTDQHHSQAHNTSNHTLDATFIALIESLT